MSTFLTGAWIIILISSLFAIALGWSIFTIILMRCIFFKQDGNGWIMKDLKELKELFKLKRLNNLN